MCINSIDQTIQLVIQGGRLRVNNIRNATDIMRLWQLLYTCDGNRGAAIAQKCHHNEIDIRAKLN